MSIDSAARPRPHTLHLPVSNPQATQIVRLDKLMEMLSLSAATIRRLAEEGHLPRPIRIGPRAIGWRLSEIEKYLAERPTVGAAAPTGEAQSTAPKA